MITIRGKTIIPKPMCIADAVEVFQDLLALTTPAAKAEPLSPETLPHILRVVQAALRRQIPDVTLDEIAEALDVTNMEQVVLAIAPVPESQKVLHQPGHA